MSAKLTRIACQVSRAFDLERYTEGREQAQESKCSEKRKKTKNYEST